MAPRKRPSVGKKPSLQWDGHLYAPQTFGEGNKPGTVDWARRQRAQRAEAAQLKRTIAEREWAEAERRAEQESLGSRVLKLLAFWR